MASPVDWPGAHCARALLDGSAVAGRWHNRTLEYRARRKLLPLDPNAFVEPEQLSLAQLPCWRGLEPERHRARVRALLAEIEQAARQREEATGRPPLGRDAVCRQNPHLEPNRVKKGPAPLVHAATPSARRAMRHAYLRFIEAFRQAASRLRLGLAEVEFPDGAFPPSLPFRATARAG